MKDQNVEKLEKAFENDMLIFKNALELVCINSAVVESELLEGRKWQFKADIECLIDDPAWSTLEILGERYGIWKSVYPLILRFKDFVMRKLPFVEDDRIYNFISEEMLDDLMEEIKLIWEDGGTTEAECYNDYR